MSTSKFRRAYSLRIPQSTKPAAFLESSGIYDRLKEPEYQEQFQGLDETEEARDSTNFSWDIPLITNSPKLNYCRKKWSSKSLRVPKTRMAESDLPDSYKEDVPESDSYNAELLKNSRLKISEGDKDSIDSHSQKESENEGDIQKNKKIKQYKKTIDRAFRRGWDNFITKSTIFHYQGHLKMAFAL